MRLTSHFKVSLFIQSLLKGVKKSRIITQKKSLVRLFLVASRIVRSSHFNFELAPLSPFR